VFQDRLAEVQRAVEKVLAARMAGYSDVPVVHAMRYAAAGGKRLRAFLVMESAALHGIGEAALPVAAAVECLHAYSLVHDDLPAMDDDDLRRGQPTVHVKWDEATAILAGDALQTLAFELCCDPVLGPSEQRIELIAALARASGAEGMVLGQALDIAAESAPAPLNLTDITRLQAGKTGALISFAAESGAILAGADRRPLSAYAAALGLAFQIADDILDIEGDPTKAGKRLGKDAGAGKATFVSLLGLEAARAQARDLVEQAETALEPYGTAAQNLREAARFVIARES
jgi:farnesyl diphosphate synthase